MERDRDETSAVIDLGTASTDTRGGVGDVIEPMGLWHKAGISDE